VIVLSGNLSDGAAITPQAALLGMNGDWPLYSQLYRGTYVYTTNAILKTNIEYKGALMGWINFTNISPPGLKGTVTWIKSVGAPTNLLYPNGFTNQIELLGSGYGAPKIGTRVLNWTNGTISLSGGDLTNILTSAIRLGTNNILTVTSLNTNNIGLTLSVPNGIFSGSFLHPITKRTTAVRGAVLQNENGGGGYFLGTNRAGTILLQGNN
jgi:hypothetical protein